MCNLVELLHIICKLKILLKLLSKNDLRQGGILTFTPNTILPVSWLISSKKRLISFFSCTNLTLASVSPASSIAWLKPFSPPTRQDYLCILPKFFKILIFFNFSQNEFRMKPEMHALVNIPLIFLVSFE